MTLTWLRETKAIFLIFCFALAVRVVFILIFPQPAPDTVRYNQIAINIKNDLSYSQDGAAPDIVTPPLYPFFLAGVYLAFGQSFTVVPLIQALLDSVTVTFIYYLALSVFNNKKIGILSAFLASLHPELVVPTSYVLSETLFTFLLVLSVLLLTKGIKREKGKSWLVAGLFLGLATLCRPTTLIFPLFLLVALLLFYRKRRRVLILELCLLITMVVIISPWTLRNYLVFREFVPVSTGFGSNLWTGSYIPWDGDWNYKDLTACQEILKGRTRIEADRKFRDEAIKNIKNNPLAYLLLCAKKCGRFWLGIPGSKEVLRGRTHIKVFLYALHYLILLLFMLGIWFLYRHWTAAFLPSVLMIFYFSLLHTALFAIPRYRIPIMPFVLIFAGAGIYQLSGKLCKTKNTNTNNHKIR